jgi:predicted N-acetyltransferase YhbS
MPRFYFHLHDDLDAVDEEGVECVDRETAMARAEGEARQLAAEEVRRGELHLDHSIVVADDRGQVIATVMFRDCVLIKG